MFSMFPQVGNWARFDTTYLADYLPLFQAKLGKNKPIEMHMRVKNIDVKFGIYDTDILLTYTLCIDFKEDKEHNTSLFYDELRMVTTGMLTTKNDLMHFQVVNHKLDTANRYS